MADIVYPSSLPAPQSSTVTPAERRALSNADRPRDARAIEFDQREFERLVWPPMNEAKIEAFANWWRTTLVLGGAWFGAKWPLPRGFITAIRKFKVQPKYDYLGGGYWRVSAVCEVRGEAIAIVNNNAWPWGGAPEDGGGGLTPWTVTVLSPSAMFPEDGTVLDPITSLPASGTYDVDSVAVAHDYASDGAELGNVWTWIGKNDFIFGGVSVQFTLNGSDFTDLAVFGVGRADDQGTTGGSGCYYKQGDIVKTDTEDTVEEVLATLGSPSDGDVITFFHGGTVIGAVDVYLNGDLVASTSGRYRDFFIRPLVNIVGDG